MWWKNLGKKVNPICLVGWDQVPFFSWPIELKFPSYNSPTQQCQRNGQTISWYNLQAFHLGVEGQACASLGYSWSYHFGQGAANMGQTKNGQLLAFSHPAALPHHVNVPASPAYIGRSLPLQCHLLSLSLSLSLAPHGPKHFFAYGLMLCLLQQHACRSHALERCKQWRAKSHRERLTVRLVRLVIVIHYL